MSIDKLSQHSNKKKENLHMVELINDERKKEQGESER